MHIIIMSKIYKNIIIYNISVVHNNVVISGLESRTLKNVSDNGCTISSSEMLEC